MNRIHRQPCAVSVTGDRPTRKLLGEFHWGTIALVILRPQPADDSKNSVLGWVSETAKDLTLAPSYVARCLIGQLPAEQAEQSAE